MQAVQPDQLRNIVITGHAGSGKTMLTESLALTMGVINRLGSIDEGNTRHFNRLTIAAAAMR